MRSPGSPLPRPAGARSSAGSPRPGRDRARLAPLGVRLVARYSHLPVLSVELPPTSLAAIAADARVEALTPQRRVRALRTEGRALMNVPALASQGIDGRGVESPCSTPAWTTPTPSSCRSTPRSSSSSTRSPTTATRATRRGTAPEWRASLPAPSAASPRPRRWSRYASSTATARGRSDQILAGLNAVVASATSGNPHNIRVANLSFGGYDDENWPPNPGECDPLSTDLAAAFSALTNAGVLVVVSAGNGGCATGVAWPACLSGALAVGAVYDANLGGRSYSGLQCSSGSCTDSSTSADTIACYTDSGDKLGVWAPSDCAATTRMGGGYDPCGNGTGTSAAAAYVSGVGALLSQAVPQHTVADLRRALTDTGRPLTDARNAVTRNRVDAAAALARLQQSCPVPAAPATLALQPAAVCGSQQLTVSWSAVADAQTYTTQVATDPTFTSPDESTWAGTSFSYTPSLTAAGTVHVRVRANGACGTHSAWSPTAQASFNATVRRRLHPHVSPFGDRPPPGGEAGVLVQRCRRLQPGRSDCRPARHLPRPHAAGAGHPRPPRPTAARLARRAWLPFRHHHRRGRRPRRRELAAARRQRADLLATDRRLRRQDEDLRPVVRGLEASEGLAGTQVGYLANLRSDAGFRTNVEFVNVAAATATVTVQFYDAAGGVLGPRSCAPSPPISASRSPRPCRPTFLPPGPRCASAPPRRG